MKLFSRLLAPFLALSFLFVIGPVPDASGQNFYKYVDKNGNIHFTDSLESIPAQYRDQMKVYKEEPKQVPPDAVKGSPKDPRLQRSEAEEKKKKEEEAKALQERTERQERLKVQEEKQNQIIALQDQIRAKQEEQKNLRTNWMVYDRIRMNQLNDEIAALFRQIQSLQQELAEIK